MSVPVSILICTRNRAPHLHGTLRSVNQVSIPDHLSPVLVVVDNGSTDATPELLRSSPVENMPLRRAVEPEPGVSNARNTALREAEGEILLWLDDDVRVSTDWLDCMTRPILKEQVEAVTGAVELARSRKRPWMQPFHRTALASTESIDPENPKNIISANMAFSRSVLDDVHGFDPELGPGTQVGALEDTLFSWQVREAGHRIGMVTETTVKHHFDEQRLTREAFVEAATVRGQSLAYIQYHWLHETHENWTHRQHPYQFWRAAPVVLVKRALDREIERWKHWLRSGDSPIRRQEFWTLMNACGLRQYLRERRRSRNYAERGLRKIRGKQVPVQEMEAGGGGRRVQ
jgi:glycosyltransferase involved in cell wall biosynthesis